MMKRFRNLTGIQLSYIFAPVVLFGAVISALLTHDRSWMGWHFSRLGEGGGVPPMFFNGGLIFGGLLMIAIGLKIKSILDKMSAKKKLHFDDRYSFLYLLVILTGLCMIIVAFFPFDRFPVLHNTAGYGTLFSVLFLAYSSPKLLPIFSEKYHKYSKILFVSAAILYSGYFIIHFPSLLIVEFILFVLIYIWLLVFQRELYEKFN